MSDPQYFIGLMSGTSADGIDAVLVDFKAASTSVIEEYSHPLSDQLRQQIAQLCTPGGDGLDLLGSLDIALGEAFAEAALALLEKSSLNATRIAAIGSHGQTVRHRPPTTPQQQGFTLQIGDPNIIAARTGITTVADFRRKDMALGGQGAPLAPGFHQQVFTSRDKNRVVINLGGIANITWLPATSGKALEQEAPKQVVLGFDTGPSNTLLDYWCQKHTSQPYDDKGSWASSGELIPKLFQQLLSHPYLQRTIPKSTGREEFSPEWLESVLVNYQDCNAEDIQATLLQFTVESIALGLEKLPATAEEAYLCGGGVFNCQLVNALQNRLPGMCIEQTSALGIKPMQVEGATFAWLAKQTMERRSGSIESVTGAVKRAVLGGIYYP